MNLAGFQDLVVGLIDEASHIPFVPLIRPVDVEVLQTNDFGEEQSLFCVAVKDLFGIAVGIEWTERFDMFLVIDHAVSSVAVGCGGGCVDKSRVALQSPITQVPGIAV